MKPFIKVTPPGPRAKAIISRDERIISPCLTREYELVVSKAYGVNLEDPDGNRYLDFASGVAVNALGHLHPAVVAAAEKQIKEAAHVAFTDFYSEIPVKFAEELIALMPKGIDSISFYNSGAEAVENALKLARHHTKRKYFISFFNSFHGRTMGSLSLTASKVIQREGFGPFLPVINVPFPYSYRNITSDQCLAFLEDEVFAKTISPTEVAAIFFEPIQGEGGYIIPPKDFVVSLRKICDDYGILLVDDEIQTGLWRTGKFLAVEHFGIKPDIVCMAKALGGGLLPLAAVATSRKITEWNACKGAYGSTFGANLLSVAAGQAALEIMSKKEFAEAVKIKGNHVIKRLNEIKEKYEIVGDVRGLGLMIALEIVENKKSKKPAADKRNKILEHAFKHGLALLPAGQSVIRIIPPLIIEKEDLDIGLDILDNAIESVK